MQDLDEDVEGMQGTIYYLQQELKKSKEKVADLEAKNREFRKLTDDRSPAQEKDVTEGNTTTADEDSKADVDKSKDLNAKFNNEDESSNDSSCLILKVNPEEEYESMFNDELAKTDEKQIESKSKRGNSDDCFKEVHSKKQKITSSSKREVDED